MKDAMSIEPFVELFTQPHCRPCRQVEALLRERGIPFVVRDVLADPLALDRLAEQGFMSTPVTRIGHQWIAGFDHKRMERALAGPPQQ